MQAPFKFSDLIEITGGKALRGGPAEALRFSTDTREIQPGDWFVALQGEKFDGHDFLEKALAAGAAGLIVSRPEAAERGPAPVLLVADTLRAYGDIAQAWRRRIAPQTVCVAGSMGKTTVKEMIALGLTHREGVLVSQGNFNNLVGLPKTLFRLTGDHRLALTEIGMNTPGELKRLTEIADPDVAVLTNIGNAHVGRFGSVEKLALAKAELLVAMRTGARLIAFADCPRSAEIIERFGSHLEVVLFGMACQAPYRAESVEAIQPWGYQFDFVFPGGRHPVRLRAFGRHNVVNALCAMAALSELGIEPARAVDALAGFEPAPMRSSARQFGGVTVIEDCYNASPAAVKAALDSLADVETTGRRHVVLGDMLELGDAEEAFHREAGHAAGSLPGAVVYGVGERARWIVEAAREAGCAPARWFATQEEAAQALAAAVAPGDVVLIKASRKMAFEEIAKALRHALGSGQTPIRSSSDP